MDFNFITTQDGSPSLRLGNEGGESEAMHSLKGAFSETVYIYGTAMETALKNGFAPSVLSLGLGLGYNELLAAGYCLRAGRGHDFSGESYEIVPELRNYFTAWLALAPASAGVTGKEIPTDFCAAYNTILELTAKQLELDPKKIRACLHTAVQDGRWRISGAMDAKTVFDRRFACICFDAFSSKTSPDLWNEEFLSQFLAQACEPKVVLSTYACTGALKRSLRAAEFKLTIRHGFSTKRDSTFATRPDVSI